MDISQEEVKVCCAEFYQQDIVKYFLGDSFHPGGLKLTKQLALKLKITREQTILDIACGEGLSCFFLAETYGCEVTGTDVSRKAISIAKEKQKTQPAQGKVTFLTADADNLPFPGNRFDAVITECSFSTFHDKERSAGEIYRVLKQGGYWGLSDMLVEQNYLPDTMRTLLFQAGCIGNAENFEGYMKEMQKAGFRVIEKEDRSSALDEMLQQVEKKLMAAKLLVSNSKLPVKLEDLKSVEELLKQGIELIQKKIIGYGIVVGKK